MIPLSIFVQRVGDPTNIYPGNPDLALVQLNIEKAVIMEAGTQSGKTTIMFIMRSPDGGLFVAETTAALLDALNSAVRGAEANWMENDNPFLGG